MSIRLIYSSAVSASISIFAVTIVTIWAELAPEFKSFLAGFAGHHWIAKSLMVLVIFPLVLGLARVFFRGEISDKQTAKSLWGLIIITIVGFAAILIFFIWHYFR